MEGVKELILLLPGHSAVLGSQDLSSINEMYTQNLFLGGRFFKPPPPVKFEYRYKLNYVKIKAQRNWVFATNPKCFISISLQTDDVLIYLCNRLYSLENLKSTAVGCKDIGIKKYEFW